MRSILILLPLLLGTSITYAVTQECGIKPEAPSECIDPQVECVCDANGNCRYVGQCSQAADPRSSA